LQVSEAFCPAGISSFFEVCDHDAAGNPLNDPARVGARGGGFAIAIGATSRVSVRRSNHARIEIRINSRPAPDAYTTRTAIEQLMSNMGPSYQVLAEIRLKVPMAAGFGTSAGGTLATCLALSDAIDSPMTLNEMGRITHIAEVVNRTGLGTASALVCGGFVLVNEPGAPGVGSVDRLPFPPDHSIVCAYLGPIQTRDALAKRGQRTRDQAARSTIEAIRKTPTLSAFLAYSREFGKRAGFETPEIGRLISTMMKAGAIGAAQNMIGEAVHGAALNSKTPKIVREVRKTFPHASVFRCPIDSQGVRLLGTDAKH